MDVHLHLNVMYPSLLGPLWQGTEKIKLSDFKQWRNNPPKKWLCDLLNQSKAKDHILARNPAPFVLLVGGCAVTPKRARLAAQVQPTQAWT